MNKWSLIFEKQGWHLLSLLLLLYGISMLNGMDGFQTGSLWGYSTTTWFRIAILFPILHQVLVWFSWRTELHTGLLSKFFGDKAFLLYAIDFSILGIGRVAVVFILAISNEASLDWYPWILKSSAVILLIPALYLFYSVRRYFGFRRAFGVDHFDPTYRTLPFENRGIFRFTSNGMYTFGFLLIWIPGLWWGSLAALTAAFFNHAYIWVHYYTTELPDIKRMYAEG